MEFTTMEQKVIKRQSEEIRRLMYENDCLKGELMEEKQAHDKDVAFLKRIIIASLRELPSRRVTLFEDSPQDAEFSLEENMSNDMIVILKSIL